VALQGTIETFPLTDVLTLLGSSAKTGRLELTGNRGTSWLWVEGGRVVGGTIEGRGVIDPARLVFELLRFSDGAFEFTAGDLDDLAVDDAAPAVLDPMPLTDGIAAAEDLLEKWRSIEAFVPSTRHRVLLATDLPSDSVTVDSATWSLIVAASRTPAVDSIAEALDLDEFDVCAAVASLIADGLATLEAPIAGAIALHSGSDPLAAVEPASDADEERDAFGASEGRGEAETGSGADEHDGNFPNRFPIDDLLGDGAMERDDPWSSPEMEQFDQGRRTGAEADDMAVASPVVESVPFGAEAPVDDLLRTEFDPVRSTAAAWNDMVDDEAPPSSGPTRSEDDTADEVLRQMSKLSPKAAEAIAAALSAVPAAETSQNRVAEDDERAGETSTFLGSF